MAKSSPHKSISTTGTKINGKISEDTDFDSEFNIRPPPLFIQIFGSIILLSISLLILSIFTDFGLSNIYRGDFGIEAQHHVEKFILQDIIRHSNYYINPNTHEINPPDSEFSIHFNQLINHNQYNDLSSYITSLKYNDSIYNISFIYPLDETISIHSTIEFSVINPLFIQNTHHHSKEIVRSGRLSVTIYLNDRPIEFPDSNIFDMELRSKTATYNLKVDLLPHGLVVGAHKLSVYTELEIYGKNNNKTKVVGENSNHTQANATKYEAYKTIYFYYLPFDTQLFRIDSKGNRIAVPIPQSRGDMMTMPLSHFDTHIVDHSNKNDSDDVNSHSIDMRLQGSEMKGDSCDMSADNTHTCTSNTVLQDVSIIETKHLHPNITISRNNISISHNDSIVSDLNDRNYENVFSSQYFIPVTNAAIIGIYKKLPSNDTSAFSTTTTTTTTTTASTSTTTTGSDVEHTKERNNNNNSSHRHETTPLTTIQSRIHVSSELNDPLQHLPVVQLLTPKNMQRVKNEVELQVVFPIILLNFSKMRLVLQYDQEHIDLTASLRQSRAQGHSDNIQESFPEDTSLLHYHLSTEENLSQFYSYSQHIQNISPGSHRLTVHIMESIRKYSHNLDNNNNNNNIDQYHEEVQYRYSSETITIISEP